MLRAFVFLSISVQMLVPPGMCLCQLAEAECAGSGDAEREEMDSERACSHCCGCGTHRIPGKLGEVQRHREAGVFGCSGRHRLPAPAHGSHAPGCPALQTPDHSKVAERSGGRPISPCDVTSFSRSAVIFAASRLERRPIPPSGPSGPPLFLVFSILLI